ncbi:hypothetical protein OIN60_21955 [Paenibacillus sp. P96]|uniref:Uncharacterized protein n=1 Tax=Paenibacillus zeirhizosphaerae TaxID=2987519 RepID=A0ABT9FXD2_9BACL|nr:hypothetical protein [Paenibacillus sp. P96]MDP4099385.1 hypothetical protein [Paenibacillus sp. P96]
MIRHLTTVHGYHKLSQYHMKLAMIFCDHNLPRSSLILCDQALTAMLQALYIQENNKPFPKGTFPMDELLYLLHTEAFPALDVVIFIGTVQYLVADMERELVSEMRKKNVNRLLRRTDEILSLLSTKIAGVSYTVDNFKKASPTNC